MNKIVLGLLVGGILGVFDGLSAWFTPAVRAQLLGIVIGSTVKGLIAGILIGYFATPIGLGGWRAGLSMLFWGLGVRMVYVLHVTWFVNSATHLWGYRNYKTTDNSRNLWWVGLLAFGEGWHNNHHAYQRVAKQGHRWWELDITYCTIWLMEKLGLAWDVVRMKDMPKVVPQA
jgi:fatty-acid desaturase